MEQTWRGMKEITEIDSGSWELWGTWRSGGPGGPGGPADWGLGNNMQAK